MDSVKIKTYVGQDGVLSLRLPIANQDVEAMVIYQPIIKNSHQESKCKFKTLLERYASKSLGDSTALLQKDRQRDSSYV